MRTLNDLILSLNSKKAIVNRRMRELNKKLRTDNKIDPADLDAHQKLNDELRAIKIWEANLSYKKNML